VGVLRLDECKARCNRERDSKGRSCVAIEWKDDGHNLASNEKRSCALLWGCDTLSHWGGGSVFEKHTQPSPTYGKRHATKQCFVDRIQYPGDRKDNPVFEGGGFVGVLRLDECKARCNRERDSKGRSCVAIEWKDDGHNLKYSEKRSCALLWGCDSLSHWGGGSVFEKWYDNGKY